MWTERNQCLVGFAFAGFQADQFRIASTQGENAEVVLQRSKDRRPELASCCVGLIRRQSFVVDVEGKDQNFATVGIDGQSFAAVSGDSDVSDAGSTPIQFAQDLCRVGIPEPHAAVLTSRDDLMRFRPDRHRNDGIRVL